jgi:hypothetical protein
MKTKPRFWIVQRESDHAFLCRDGLWRRHLAGIEEFRTFKRDTNAIKFGLKYQAGTAYALYDTDALDVTGQITRNADRFANVSSIIHKRTRTR